MNEIKDKIALLLSDNVFTSEKDIIYFLVEVRKLLEKTKVLDQYKIVKFYCDWALHPEKDRNLRDMQEYMLLLETKESELIGQRSMFKMLPLKEELSKVLVKLHITDFTQENDVWRRFRKQLFYVLSEQPFNIGKLDESKVAYVMYVSETSSFDVEYKPTVNGRHRGTSYMGNL